MKKLFLTLMIGLLAIFGVACSSENADANKVSVAASAVPHAEILEFVKPQLEKQGIELEVKVFQDYVLPNKVVEEGELDANFFQHQPWMETTNKEQNYHIKKVVGVHIEPMGAYSQKIKKIEELKNGSKIAIPNGTSEINRVLLLLESQKLIELDQKEGEKTLKSIKSNPKNLEFVLLEPATLPRFLGEVDLAIINTNYAIEAKLNPLKDAIFIEGSESPYVNVLATKEGMENQEAIQKLAKALTSPETKEFIQKKYDGAVVPAF
ncbi:MetQ/NlpA family ABC transporter substrate-binding protein [Hazenella coriacea]|uniref:D-methionine transport system substrate-binding protein n=1 Tax=Hazenella coriacea TaxID=1179467 RepID=A0A4R3LDV3_9BACL|nr:MetQ/NlpA family ABC transporter substrate-binding protein [Hazenella coriacea]TCS95636.1 D-methionine transport system substrate-binding protein [Hazenella coriacea]